MSNIVVQFVATNQTVPLSIVATKNDNRSMDVEDLLLSLAMQVKVRLEKLGARPENIEQAIKNVGERAGLTVTDAENVASQGAIAIRGAYNLDMGVIRYRDMTAQKMYEIKRKIPAVKWVTQQTVAVVISGLRKLAHKE
jgi:excinuclease UvrABC nuclease subunit